MIQIIQKIDSYFTGLDKVTSEAPGIDILIEKVINFLEFALQLWWFKSLFDRKKTTKFKEN